MHASYAPAFEACVQEGKAESVMCSYNAVNGKPACASPELLQGTLRGALGFEGVIVSDCGAVDGVFNLHEYTKCGGGVASAVGASPVLLGAGAVLITQTFLLLNGCVEFH